MSKLISKSYTSVLPSILETMVTSYFSQNMSENFGKGYLTEFCQIWVKLGVVVVETDFI